MKTFSTFTGEMLVKVMRKVITLLLKSCFIAIKIKFSAISTLLPTTGAYRGYIQETFIKAITTIKQGRYVESGKFVAWISRIAHNLVIDFYRKEANQNTYSNDAYDYDLLNNSSLCEQHIEDTIIHEQTMNDMLKLVDLLPQNQQDIVRMRFYENMSFKEIAESNQISINTALGRMRYAILNLRKYAAERNLLIDFEKIT